MKKFLVILMGLVLALSVTACSGGAAETTQAQTTAAQTEAPETAAPTAEETAGQETAEQQTEASAETEGTGSSVLVVYFSATGNTEAAANYIAELTGADLVKLEAAEPYSDEDLNYNDENSRVSYEHENPDAQNVELVADTVEGWDTYETVFVGYPIWWGEAAWPINDFIEANDFTGKTVVPFCTSASSGLGDSAELLAEMAGTGDWLEGQRFSSNVSEEDVQSWLEGLGLL